MRPIDADALIPIMKYTTTDNEIGVFPIRIGFDAIKEVIDEAPTIEPTDTDLISRQDAIEMAVDVETPQGTYERAIYVDDLMALPSADAVQGEWKPFDLTWGRNVYFCTACQKSTEVPTVNGQPSYNFCPNCGARMKGGAE